jgi:VWFA-related protein
MLSQGQRGVRAGVLFLLSAAVMPGQQPAAPDSGIVIRSTTRLVQVRVVAEDSQGKPVTDLQRDDFQVFDNRKAQPITLFSADRGTEASAPGAVEGPAVLDAAPNGVEPAGYALFVLDWLNTPYSDRVQAKELAIGLLKKFQPRQKVAVYLLSHKPGLVHDFTSDIPELIQAIEDAGLQPEDLGEETFGRFDARYGSPRDRSTVEEKLFFMRNRIEDSMAVFRTMVAGLTRVPGRKSLVWLSAGFPVTVGPGTIPGAKPADLNYRQDVEKLFQALNRADIAVNAVNAHALSTKPGAHSETLMEFAERTGGTYFGDRNDLDEGIKLAFEDMRVSYIVGFNVPDTATPGLHEIRVQVSRKGVHLRYRESYQVEEKPGG